MLKRRVIYICLLFTLTINILVYAKEIISEYQMENLKGFLFYEEENYEQAIVCFLRTIELNPKYTTAFNNLGSSYYQLNDYDQAIYYFQKALELDENYSKAYLNLSACYFWKGRYLKAYNIYLKSKKVDPQYTESRIDRKKYILHIENKLKEDTEDEELKKIYSIILEYEQGE